MSWAAASSLWMRSTGGASAARLLCGAKLRTPGAVVFAYHDIGDDPANTTDYFISPSTFRKQLRLATAWGIRFVPLGELTARVLAHKPVDGLGAVVFDDSICGVHHHAMPVLLDLGIPATVFTVTAALGQDPPWWPGAKRVMTKAEAIEMAGAGFEIASHTRTHASLPDSSPSQLIDELQGSRSELEDLTQRPGQSFAYPFGHYDERVREGVESAGYEAAYSFLNGRVTSDLDPFRLPRLNMYPGQGRLRLAYHLARSPQSWPDSQLPAVAHVERKR